MAKVPLTVKPFWVFSIFMTVIDHSLCIIAASSVSKIISHNFHLVCNKIWIYYPRFTNNFFALTFSFAVLPKLARKNVLYKYWKCQTFHRCDFLLKKFSQQKLDIHFRVVFLVWGMRMEYEVVTNAA